LGKPLEVLRTMTTVSREVRAWVSEYRKHRQKVAEEKKRAAAAEEAAKQRDHVSDSDLVEEG